MRPLSRFRNIDHIEYKILLLETNELFRVNVGSAWHGGSPCASDPADTSLILGIPEINRAPLLSL